MNGREGGFALELSGISKAFGPVRALDGAHLALRPGEIHALLGENGAGKSTLVSIAAGLVPPDAGTIRLAGKPMAFRGPRQARRAGIALVPQHDLLVEAATVADNLAFLDPAAPFLESRRARRERVARVASALDLDVGPPDARVGELPVGTRQRLEVAGALLTDPSVLILDEPTAVLSPDETAALFRALRARASTGKTVLLITHRLAEVFAAADRLTLLARGRTLREAAVGETSAEEIGALLLGSAEATERTGAPEREAPPADAPPAGGVAVDGGGGGTGPSPALALRALRPRGSAAPPVDLAVAPGELVVLLSIDGNGADDLAGAAAGVREAEGSIEIGGRKVRPGDPLAYRRAGGAFIPSDRRAEGLLPDLTLAENLLLRRPPGGLLVDRAAMAATAADRLARFGVRATGPDARAGELSGGNQQKLLLARELEPLPRVLTAIHPTRGLDLAASADVRARLLDAAASGAGVLVVTADPEEAQAFGRPIRVVYRGRLSEPLPSGTPFEALGRRMAGLAA